jgi:hypothetical protein
MPRSTALDANAIAPGSLVVSAVVGVTLATGGFVIGIGATGPRGRHDLVLVPEPHTGFVAYLLLWGSVTWVCCSAPERAGPGCDRPQLLDAHQFLSAAGAGFACFHSLVLMGDRYVSFPLRAVILPFGGSYEPACSVAVGRSRRGLSAAHCQLPRSAAYRRPCLAPPALCELRGVLVGRRTPDCCSAPNASPYGPTSCT